MSSLFGSKTAQTPEAPAPPPTVNEAAQNQDYLDRLRKRKGAASTILVPDYIGAKPQSGAKAVLGA